MHRMDCERPASPCVYPQMSRISQTQGERQGHPWYSSSVGSSRGFLRFREDGRFGGKLRDREMLTLLAIPC